MIPWMQIKAWEKIKNNCRDKLHQSEVYSDDNKNIIVFNREGDSVIIIGYLYYTGSRSLSIPARDIVDFIDYIKKLGNENYNSYEIFILCDFRLSRVGKANEIMSLPKDVKYVYVDYNQYYDTIEFKFENQLKAAELNEQNKIPWYGRMGIPVITDSIFQDWDKWVKRGYNREWFDWNDKERFDDWYDDMIPCFEWYIDERLLGFL